MAHELEQRNGKIEAAFALRGAWHGLGTVVDHAPDSSEMLKLAGLDWQVIADQPHTSDMQPITGWKCTMRADTREVLGMVSEKYQILQNAAAFDFLDGLQQDGVIRYESAGALNGGKRVWVLARMPSVDHIAAGDDLLRYALFTTSHDGTSQVMVTPTSVRVVCANTLRMAISGGALCRFKHTSNMQSRLSQAHRMISQFDAAFTDFTEKGRALVAKQCNVTQLREYMEKLFPTPETEGRALTIRTNWAKQVLTRFDSRDTNALASIRGTYWAALNAVTETTDHAGVWRGEGNERAENRFASTMLGVDAEWKETALSTALELAGVS